MNELQVNEVRQGELLAQVSPIEKFANDLIIKTDDDNIFASEKLKIIKGMQKDVGLFIDGPVAAANALWKSLCDKRNQLSDPLKRAEKTIKEKIARFLTDKENERRRLQYEAEAKARSEEERKRKELEDKARIAEEAGKAAKAEELRAKAETVQVVAKFVAPIATKTKGVSMIDYWEIEVTDKSLVPEEYKIVDISMVNKVANATKGALPIPGCAIHKRQRISSRAA